MKLLRADDKIDVGQVFEKRSAPCLGHASEKTKNDMRPFLGHVSKHSHLAERLLIGHVANAAGVQQHHVGVRFGLGAFVAAFNKRMRDLFRVALVHLAAVGFDEKLGH